MGDRSRGRTEKIVQIDDDEGPDEEKLRPLGLITKKSPDFLVTKARIWGLKRLKSLVQLRLHGRQGKAAPALSGLWRKPGK
jgi:hypothetical protein